MHESVLLNEAIEALAIRPDGTYVDATFGRGGHSRAILERLGPQGHLIALDRDPEAERAAREIRDARFTFHRTAFSALATALGERSVQGIVFDLGVSSPQLDDPQRGFSFRADGPLDMRMDATRGTPVSEWLAHAGLDERREVIAALGEERFARRVAEAIVAERRQTPITRTSQLAALVA